jgi:hypothetical protein
MEVGNRGEDAGAADLDRDFFEESFFLLRGVFKGGGPARGPGCEAEGFALVEVEDLDDGSVGAVTEVVAFDVERADRG